MNIDQEKKCEKYKMPFRSLCFLLLLLEIRYRKLYEEYKVRNDGAYDLKMEQIYC